MRLSPATQIPAADVDEQTLNRYSETFGVTQTLERDIIEFLSAKYTGNATISLKEVMSLYHCPVDRARRVIASLVEEEILVGTDTDVYRVTI